ncbi:mitochondrial fission ELM1 family protein [Oleiagrimonas sp. C23AA]|uniref:mitochondrial fission ELM1 family protein n=1 Tax=Oleiagrimonas sp. C23AA TaxID=2719047 RepID=UPI0031B6B634
MNRCWTLTNGAAGNDRQARALARAMGLRANPHLVQPGPPWSWLAPHLVQRAPHALNALQKSAFQAPWPALAIGCGRDAALYTRWLKREGHCRAVQILDPRADPHHWDVVVAPEHDRLQGANVITTLGALNPIDDEWLRNGRMDFAAIGELPAPRLTVLLGGPRRGVKMDAAYAERLGQALRARWRADGGSVLLLASRRTPPALFDAVKSHLADIPGLHWRHQDDGANPFAGAMGWAHRLVVTPDSVNMLSEACATGLAVHSLVESELPEKLARFHGRLRERGLLHDIDASTPTQQPALRESVRVAEQVRWRLSIPAPQPPPGSGTKA